MAQDDRLREPAGACRSDPADVERRLERHRAALETLDDIPLAEHAAVYAELHGDLQAALAAIDRG